MAIFKSPHTGSNKDHLKLKSDWLGQVFHPSLHAGVEALTVIIMEVRTDKVVRSGPLYGDTLVFKYLSVI